MLETKDALQELDDTEKMPPSGLYSEQKRDDKPGGARESSG